MTNSIKENIEFVGKNYNKEMTKFAIINVVLILAAPVIYFFTKNLIYSLIPLGFTLVIDYLLISNYSAQKQKVLQQRDEEFIQMISYFEIFINNQITVYQSFKFLLPYASRWMSEQIGNMLDEIDKDKTVKPFIDFARKFKSSIVENVMISIYQMVDQGQTVEQLQQFSIFFSQLSKNNQKTLIDRKERSLSSMDTYPLIGTGGMTIIITISILLLLGDIVNVI